MNKFKDLINKKNRSKIICLTSYSKNVASILDKHCDMELYYTEQTIWKLNIDEYTRRRNKLKGKYVG